MVGPGWESNSCWGGGPPRAWDGMQCSAGPDLQWDPRIEVKRQWKVMRSVKGKQASHQNPAEPHSGPDKHRKQAQWWGQARLWMVNAGGLGPRALSILGAHWGTERLRVSLSITQVECGRKWIGTHSCLMPQPVLPSSLVSRQTSLDGGVLREASLGPSVGGKSPGRSWGWWWRAPLFQVLVPCPQPRPQGRGEGPRPPFWLCPRLPPPPLVLLHLFLLLCMHAAGYYPGPSQLPFLHTHTHTHVYFL